MLKKEIDKRYYLKHRKQILKKQKLYQQINKNKFRIYKKNWLRNKRNTTKQTLSISETWRGRKAEKIALKLLNNSIDNNKGAMNKEYDILWNGYKIDVKSCNFYYPPKRKNGQWIFNKNKGNADFYFCICMTDNIPYKYYLIPAKDFKNGISIGFRSKYDKFLFNI